jgi:hypothetical protein
MATTGTCPRGHALADDAVLCTVCWIRVEPVDPVVIAERKRRQRRIWIPLMGAGAVALGVVVGGTLGVGSGSGPSLVAGEAAPTPAPSAAATAASPAEAASAPAQATPSPAEEPASVTAPLAATVAESTNPALETCVPAATASVLLKGRSSTDEPWLEAASETVIGEQSGCPAGEVTVTVTSDTDAQRWRLVLRNGDGQRVGKLTLDAPTG